jgi:carbon storage regulator
MQCFFLLSQRQDPCQGTVEPLAWYEFQNIWLGSEVKSVLVLSRKIGERILIGDNISVTVVKIGHGGVRIGIEAPPELAVVREELARELERVDRANATRQVDAIAEKELTR